MKDFKGLLHPEETRIPSRENGRQFYALAMKLRNGQNLFNR
jgi:hypothetical protein